MNESIDHDALFGVVALKEQGGDGSLKDPCGHHITFV